MKASDNRFYVKFMQLKIGLLLVVYSYKFIYVWQQSILYHFTLLLYSKTETRDLIG